MELVMVGEEPAFNIPPPFKVALFPEMVELVRLGDESRLNIAPPSSALFPEMVQLVMVEEE